MDPIMTPGEWMKNPSWHGSYDDYVQHVKSVHRMIQKERDDALAENIASRLAAKLKAKRPNAAKKSATTRK